MWVVCALVSVDLEVNDNEHITAGAPISTATYSVLIACAPLVN